MGHLRSCRFDGLALWRAMEARRQERGLTWTQVAAEMNAASSELGERLGARNHPLDPATIKRMKGRGDAGCQHALGYLSWLGATPESFLTGIAQPVAEERLPVVGSDRRLRWNIAALAAAVDEQRRERGLTWWQLADELGCAVGQVSGLRRIRYGIGMTLAMRLTQWLGRSAASFTFAAEW